MNCMRLLCVIALAACKPAPAPAPVAMTNRAQPATDAAAGCTVSGRIVDAANGDALPGATVLATGSGVKEEGVVSDIDGAFTLPVTPGHDVLTIYYTEGKKTRPLVCNAVLAVRVTEPYSKLPKIAW